MRISDCSSDVCSSDLQARVIELNASRKEAERRRQGILAQTRREMLDLQQQSEQKAVALTQELKKAEQRDHLMSLTAPVDGTVQRSEERRVGKEGVGKVRSRG